MNKKIAPKIGLIITAIGLIINLLPKFPEMGILTTSIIFTAISVPFLFIEKVKPNMLRLPLMGSYLGLIVVSSLHTLLLLVTLFSSPFSDFRLGYQFLITIYGIVPTMILGLVLGGVVALIRHDSIKRI